MRRIIFMFLVLVLALAFNSTAFCEAPKGSDRGEGYMGGPGNGCMMGPGYGGGPGHMMGYDPHHGMGMYGRGWKGDQKPRAWHSMTPGQKDKWQQMHSAYLLDTLEIRKQVAAKHIELETLWAQPNVDRAKVEALSNELADLQSQLRKKHDHYIIKCRETFGDQEWSCPGGRW